MNYLRFMGNEEFEAYKRNEPFMNHRIWREGDTPKHYFFGVKIDSLEDIDLPEVIGDGYYWIHSTMAWDIVNKKEEFQYKYAVLFKGDDSLEKEEDMMYGMFEQPYKEFKADFYNHLEMIDVKECDYDIYQDKTYLK